MMKNAILGLGLLLATSALASPSDDFFIKALRQSAGAEVTNMVLAQTGEVFGKRAQEGISKFGHSLGLNDNRDQVDTYQVQFDVDMNGSKERVSCLGTLRQQANMNERQRMVTVRDCSKDFRPNIHNGMAVNNQRVDLP
jgi:hypothetical protein